MSFRWNRLVFGLCLAGLAQGCAAESSYPPPDDAPTDAKGDLPAVDDARPDDASDAPSLDASDDAKPVDAAEDADAAAPDDAVDAPADVARPDVGADAPCRTRCSGFCTDPDTDPTNCGACGNDCTLRPGVDIPRVRCAAGRCDFSGACLAGRQNCSGNPDDGCETAVNTPARCGSCANACREPSPNCGAMAGAPGGFACTSGCTPPTPARCGAACVDLTGDARNCGACGTVCPSTSTGAAMCVAGRCTLACAAGYGDCDGNPANGCETSVRTSAAHCGACGNACPAMPGSTPLCAAGVCNVTCAGGQGNCDGVPTNGCETDLRASVANCGACANACPARPNSAPACTSGACGVLCNAGYTNCNASVVDGCEARLTSDPLNCGACARRCAAAANASASCADGACGVTCLAGYGNCDGNGLNGCEVALNADPRNCGACGTACPSAPGAAASCAAGRCGLTCSAGQGDCDMSAATGCEVDLTASNTHCGACGRACNGPSNGRGQCTASRCVITCDDGYALSGELCVRASPRPVSPAAAAFSTSRRPAFRVALPLGQTGARVEVCGDRACTSVASAFTFAGASGDAAISLAPGTYFWRASGTIAGSVVTSASAVAEFTVSAGAATAVASSWGTALDANADRYPDLLVGAPSLSRAQYYPNSAGSLSTLFSTISLASTGGASVASAGDVNGDGYVDAVAGSATGNVVTVHHGSPSGLAAAASATLMAPAGVTRFGASVASAGDVNGDGYSDVLVGAPGSNRAYLYRGSSTGLDTMAPLLLLPTGSGANFGVSVAGVGDLNADGFADVAVGTDGASIVYVWFGAAAGLGPTPAGLSAPAGAAGFGRAVAAAGDVSGDGYPDVIVGAYNSATAYVFLGASTGVNGAPAATLSGGGSQFGLAVDGLGDVNGDGFGDVLVGAPGSERAYVFAGRAGGAMPTPLVTLTPTYAGYTFGASVAGLGDLNNDGFMDFAVGAPSRVAQIYRGGAAGPVLYQNLTGSTSFATSIAARAARPVPRI